MQMQDKPAAPIETLRQIMRQLRDPQHGCPWDIEQNFASIAPYTIEEAYEVAEAIRTGNMASLKEELGDLLLQVIFHAQMADEQKLFDFDAVAQSICQKMIARHPHIFGETTSGDADAVKARWEDIKAAERAAKGKSASALDDVALALPALMRAEKLQKRAARLGFDWPEIAPVYAKIEEELKEVQTAANPVEQQEEIGDLLFACVNLARHLSVDPEEALRRANDKFTTRFHYVEQQVNTSGKPFDAHTLDELENHWQAAKQTAA